MDLYMCVCVAGRYPERTSNFDTLHAYTQQFTLSLSDGVACSSK